jgi:hypothetical protein
MQALIVYRDEGSVAEATVAGEASENAMEAGDRKSGSALMAEPDESVDTMACTSA